MWAVLRSRHPLAFSTLAPRPTPRLQAAQLAWYATHTTYELSALGKPILKDPLELDVSAVSIAAAKVCCSRASGRPVTMLFVAPLCTRFAGQRLG